MSDRANLTIDLKHLCERTINSLNAFIHLVFYTKWHESTKKSLPFNARHSVILCVAVFFNHLSRSQVKPFLLINFAKKICVAH